MKQHFETFKLKENLLRALLEMGFTDATEVQTRSIPKILEHKDLIVMSKTGSGKTGAFGIPILQNIEKSDDGPQALVLTPTRELAVQVDQDLKTMSKHLAIRTAVVYGGHGLAPEIEKFARGIDFLTGTPGRVLDHLMQGHFKPQNIKYLVLDEADRMLDMGFIDQVHKIIKRIPNQRVTLLFSATMPAEIQKLCKIYMKSPEIIELESDTKTVDTIEQLYYKVEQNEKRKQLLRILTVQQPESCIVFCNTRITVDRVHAFLTSQGFASSAIHGANTQSNRMRSIQQFKKGTFEVLCATDVAARGLHIDDLSLVVNYDVPQDKDSYVHRIGRTGRAGNGGRAITLVTKDDLFTLYEIEEHVGVLISEEPLPTDEQVAQMPVRKKPAYVPKPQATKPHAAKPQVSKPHVSKPQSTKTQTAKPQAAKPQTAKPHNAKPHTTKPYTASAQTPVPHTPTRKSYEPQKIEHVKEQTKQPIIPAENNVKKQSVLKKVWTRLFGK